MPRSAGLLLVACCALLVTTTASTQSTPFVLAVPEGTSLCGHAAHRSATPNATHAVLLRTEYLRQCRVDLRAATYELRWDAPFPGLDWVEAIYFGPDRAPAATASEPFGDLSSLPTGQGRRYFFTASQQFQIGEETFQLIVGLPVFETVDGQPTTPQLDFDARIISRDVLSGANDSIALDLCGLPHFPLFRLDAHTHAGPRLTLYYRKRPLTGGFNIDPLEILRARPRLGQTQRDITQETMLFYGSDFHNFDQRFGLRLDPPIDGAHFVGLYENLNFQTFEPEPYLELLDANWTPLASYPVTTYEITEIDRLPPLHSVFLLR